MEYSTYQSITGIIQNISTENSCCTWMVSVRNGSDTVNFIVTGDTKIIDNTRLRRGMRIAAFYDANLPAPAIFHPNFKPS